MISFTTLLISVLGNNDLEITMLEKNDQKDCIDSLIEVDYQDEHDERLKILENLPSVIDQYHKWIEIEGK